MYMFDMSAFYRKRIADFSSSARSNGGFTETAPYVGIADASLGGGAGPIDWASVQPYLQVRPARCRQPRVTLCIRWR
jgi:alpha-L-rhamnosidase